MIREIRISNYKSFNNIKLELKRFNVLIGANASGKSNLVSVFKFLLDFVKHGLKDAISMHGGNEYIKNLNLDNNQLSIGFSFNFSKKKEFSIYDEFMVEYYIRCIEDVDYDLTISFKDKSYTILKEEVVFNSQKLDVLDRHIQYSYRIKSLYKNIELMKNAIEKGTNPNAKIELEKDLQMLMKEIAKLSEKKERIETIKKDLKEKMRGTTHLIIKRLNDSYHYLLQDKKKEVKIEIFPRSNYIEQLEIPKNKCIFESGILFQIEPLMLIRDFLNNISLYDIDPKSAKNISLITGKTELESDGSNLVIAMKNLSEKTEERKKFIQLLKDFLPFIEDIETEKIADRLLLTTLKEKYSHKIFIPAPLISDGTMNISALIYVLLFEDKPFLVFEEPERNLHPRLVSKLISLMKDVSERMQEKQIIITTHNPQILKYTEIESLLLIYRDEEGFSQISLPSQNKQVKIFLENELGIDELFVQNLLG